jgi:hypothetical protein
MALQRLMQQLRPGRHRKIRGLAAATRFGAWSRQADRLEEAVA